MHWPFPNHHEPGVDVTSRHADAQPYVHERFMSTWAQMEELVTGGLVRNIGTSNMTVAKLLPLLTDVSIPPAVNEMELHPHFQQPELFDFVVRPPSCRSGTARSAGRLAPSVTGRRPIRTTSRTR